MRCKWKGECANADTDGCHSACTGFAIDTCEVRDTNIGNSDYSKHKIQPWDIWLEYDMNPWDADIIKRMLRTKEESGMTSNEARILDYQKIKHICDERIRQLKL